MKGMKLLCLKLLLADEGEEVIAPRRFFSLHYHRIYD
jgi:hypothetical protein